MGVEFCGGIPVMRTNTTSVAASKKWYVSYCWSAQEFGCPTTAIVYNGADGVGVRFLVANGDQREALQTFLDADDYPGAVDWFRQRPDLWNKLSEHPDFWLVWDNGKLRPVPESEYLAKQGV